ncbi:hypothetical protein [Micromonospora sp. NPDC006431]|uniref:hypothetical protein n=1 Tax=Micromonospora sp. NPDC006431 TaxID=3364235 RepID=UPI0036C3C0B4
MVWISADSAAPRGRRSPPAWTSCTPATPSSYPALDRLALGISPGTLYHHIPDLRELRAAGRARHQFPAGVTD